MKSSTTSVPRDSPLTGIESGWSGNKAPYWKKLGPPAAVVMLILAMQWPILSGYYSFLETGPDITVMNVPDLELRARALRSAIIPIWDPYQLGGESMLGIVTPALLDPFSYPLLLMPLENGHIPFQYIQWYFAFLHCAAGLAAYLLVRDLGLRFETAAVAAGIFYAMGGLPGNSAWIQFVTEAIYSPLVLMYLLRSLRGRLPLRNSAIAGLFLGLSWFSGTHHIPYVTFAFCAAILLGFALLGNPRQRLLQMAVFTGTMFCISAPQVLPALEAAQLSTRWVGLNAPVVGNVKVPFASHYAGGLHVPSLLGIIFPLDHLYWTGAIMFAGVVAVAFAILGSVRITNSRLVRLCIALLIGGILMSLPRNDLLYGLAYLFIPMLDKVRETSVWLFVTHIGIACLVGVGIEEFLGGFRPDLQRMMAKVLSLLGVGLLPISYVWQLTGKPQYETANDRLALSGLIALLLGGLFFLNQRKMLRSTITSVLAITLLMIELGNVSGLGGTIYFPRGNGYESRYEEPLRATDALANFLRSRKDLVRVDVNPNDVPFNFGDLQSVEELSTHPALMLTSVFEMGIWTPRTKQLYGVNYYLGRKPSQPDQVDLFTASSGIKVFSNPNARPRVWTVHQVLKAQNYDQARALLSAKSFDISKTTFVNTEPPALESCGGEDRVELLKRGWFSVKISATMSCSGMVILNDNWYPGWRSTVDGRRTRLYSAYMCIRGIVVPAGQHVIRIKYLPLPFFVGIILFLLGIGSTFWLMRHDKAAWEDALGV